LKTARKSKICSLGNVGRAGLPAFDPYRLIVGTRSPKRTAG
jgi:hypothetical protein